jgi:hypothetical protein
VYIVSFSNLHRKRERCSLLLTLLNEMHSFPWKTRLGYRRLPFIETQSKLNRNLLRNWMLSIFLSLFSPSLTITLLLSIVWLSVDCLLLLLSLCYNFSYWYWHSWMFLLWTQQVHMHQLKRYQYYKREICSSRSTTQS